MSVVVPPIGVCNGRVSGLTFQFRSVLVSGSLAVSVSTVSDSVRLMCFVMAASVEKFHFPFVGLSGCQDGGGRGLVFSSAEVTFRRMGIWLCGDCFKTHTHRTRCRHGSGSSIVFVDPPNSRDGIIRFILYGFQKPQAPTSELSSSDAPREHQFSFDVALLDTLLSKRLRSVKSIPPKYRLGFSRVLKGALDKVICRPDDIACWVQLLVLPLCVLSTFSPRSNRECSSGVRRRRQEESITSAIYSWGESGGSERLVIDTLASVSPLDVDEDHGLAERNIKQCKRKISDGHYTAAVRVLSSSGLAPYSDATLTDLQAKHPFFPVPTLPDIPVDHHLTTSSAVVLEQIRGFPRGTSCGRYGLRAQHLLDCLGGAAVAVSDELVDAITQVVNLFLAGKCPGELGGYIASAPLTPLVKPGGGIQPIVVGTIWRRLVSKVGAALIGPRLGTYLGGLQFGVGVPAGGEAILHAVNRLVEARGADVGLFMLLLDFQNAFNLVDRSALLREVRLHCPALSRWVEFCYSSPARLYYGEHTLWSCQGVQQGDPLGPFLFSLVLHPLVCQIRDSFDLSLQAWYLDDGTIVGDALVVGKVLELILEEGPHLGLHVNVEKIEVFWPWKDPRSRLESVFPSDIARLALGVKLLGGPVSTDSSFCKELVSQCVSKTVVLMDAVAKLNDPQCELLLLRACTGVSKLYFAMRTCPPHLFEAAQLSFDVALRASLERIVTDSGPGFGDWQWRLATLPYSYGGLGVYSAGDVWHYAFLASRLQSSGLQDSLLRLSGVDGPGSAFDDALGLFNRTVETDLMSSPSEIASPPFMKKLADIYFMKVTADAESAFSLS
ncbi:uncharacterized protein [Spinacia oleracea]|uniref:Reverse transcriptase domain-containing protein n=1 Tax=Spinacia oleracea TaxID=3562 RepID=A0ABM3RC67_SPIOL|nr:uncharacterized protein LOC130467977 [Spinacia oleracea]